MMELIETFKQKHLLKEEVYKFATKIKSKQIKVQYNV